MDLEEYKQLLEYRFNFVRNGYEFKYEENCDYNVATEIIAYLITINFFYSDESNSGYDNLTNYYRKIYKEELEREYAKEDRESFTIEELIEREKKDKRDNNNFRKIQRREEKIRLIMENYQKYLSQNGFNTSRISYMSTEQTGRFYDLANLEFISQRLVIDKPFDLYDMVVSGRICNSKKVDSITLADAYEVLNSQYAKAKNTEDKMEYIVKWINFYRMEMSMRYSLIYKIADYISQHGLVKDFALLRMTDVWGVRTLGKDNFICPPFQILRHEKFIEPYFSAQTEEELSRVIEYAEKERILENIMVKEVVDEAERFFFHFRNLDESAIEKTYLFCKNEYPIIENYVPATLNLKEDTTKVDVKKIKCIRKIFEHMLHPAEFKRY